MNKIKIITVLLILSILNSVYFEYFGGFSLTVSFAPITNKITIYRIFLLTNAIYSGIIYL